VVDTVPHLSGGKTQTSEVGGGVNATKGGTTNPVGKNFFEILSNDDLNSRDDAKRAVSHHKEKEV